MIKVEKLQKIVSILLIVMFLCTIASNVLALTPSEITGENTEVNTEKISSVGNSLVKILQAVGITISVVILIVIGIKYMLGSPEEKSEYKKTMIPYVVGAALIFTASALAQIIYDFFIGIK